MNKQAVASELVKIAKELTASVRNITLEAWAYQATISTIVVFTERDYRFLQRGDGAGYGYLHFQEGGRPSSPPTEELRNVLIDYWHKGWKRENAAGLSGPVAAWAFQGLSHADMETILREKIYLNR